MVRPLRKETACCVGDEYDYIVPSRRTQSLESHLECFENKNVRTKVLTGKLNISLQMQTKTQLVRKLPALEVKGVSLNVKGNNNMIST